MTVDRRRFLAGGMAAALVRASAPAAAAEVSAVLQAKIDAAQKGSGLVELGPGSFAVSGLKITGPVTLRGVPGRTVLQAAQPGLILDIDTAANVVVDGIVFDGQNLPPQTDKPAENQFLLLAYQCSGLRIANCSFRKARTSGVNLDACTGWFQDNELVDLNEVGLTSGRSWGQYQPEAKGARGMVISGNRLTQMGSGGISIVHGGKSGSEDDSSIISGNTVTHVRSPRGTGPYGNGIDVFASAHVTVVNNRVSDCDYGGIRVVSSTSCTVTGNTISQIADNGIFVEFALEGVVVSGNVIDDCAGGIEISGGEGMVGQVAVCTGNIVRNITRPQFNPQGSPFMGITVSAAQSNCSGNVVDTVASNARGPGIGIYLADWAASHGHQVSGNMVRGAACGIGITLGDGAAHVSVTGNTITGAKLAAISLLEQVNYADQTTKLIKVVGPDLVRNPQGSELVLASGNIALP